VIEIFDVICIGAALVDMVAQVVRHPAEDDDLLKMMKYSYQT
jgi:sugar/nucleoside kinase (ribokinase family)